MSLQVWLPLTGNLKNKGATDYNLSMFRGSEVYNDSGKIGKCFHSNGVNTIKILNIIPDFYNYTGYSLCAWFYIEAQNTSHSGSAIISAGNWNNQVLNLALSDWSTDHYTNLRVSGPSWSRAYQYTFNKNTWYHVVVSSDGNKTRAYVNGALIGDAVSGFLPTSIQGDDICIGGATYYGGMQFFGRINDVRIYDHSLSLAEIKELSKGLVVHYKLDDFICSDNLIVNGFGELGTENWTSTAISTTEIPSGHSEIKASFYSGNMTKEYIPICRNHTYTISGYVKAMSGQTGSKYPSIYPYDIDKNFINHFNSRDGFDINTATTLTQALNPGDTVIHAADLSNWRVDTTSYYYRVAIFGYKDSYGQTYDDLTYTQDCPAFGTRTDKSNIDKTNNTITLKAAYTGVSRPAGTKICQATEGSTYYYPWGAIAVTSVEDWTFKTKDLKPSATNRLWASAYFRWSTYGGLYIAGNKLIDNFNTNTDIIDSSGYGNHGIRNGNTSNSYNTPRYDVSSVFDGSTSYIEANPLPLETKTISIWLKTSWVSSSGYRLAVHDKNTGLAIGWASSQLITYVGSSNGGSGSRIDITTTNYTANQWNHIVVVKTGTTTRNVYVNGVLATPSSANYWGGDQLTLNIGNRHISGAYSAYFNGQLSDFRAYATELSAEDVLALYNTGARIAKDGTMLAYQMKEGV